MEQDNIVEKAYQASHRLGRLHLPRLVAALREAMTERLWEASERTRSDAERTTITGDIAILSHAAGERLREIMYSQLLSEAWTSDGKTTERTARFQQPGLELVDKERFELWLARDKATQYLEDALSDPLRNLQGMAQTAFGAQADLPLAPGIIVHAVEEALVQLGVSSTSISLCLRDFPGPVVDLMRALYDNVVSEWDALGISVSGSPPLPGAVMSDTKAKTSAGAGKSPPQPRHRKSADRVVDWLLSKAAKGGKGDSIDGAPASGAQHDMPPDVAAIIKSDPRLSERIGVANRVLRNLTRSPGMAPSLHKLIDEYRLRFTALAVEDPAFFRNANHPVIGLIDQLERLSLVVQDDSDLTPLVERAMQADVRDLSAFRALSAEIDALVRELGGQAQRNLQRLVASLEGKQRFRDVDNRVRRRINRTLSGRRMHRAVCLLIDAGWRKLLNLIAMREGIESPTWKRYWNVLLGAHLHTGGEPQTYAIDIPSAKDIIDSVNSGLEYLGFNTFRRGDILETIQSALAAAQNENLNEGHFVRLAELPPLETRPPRDIPLPQGMSADDWAKALQRVDHLARGSLLKLQEGDALVWHLVWRGEDGHELVFADKRCNRAITQWRTKLALSLARGTARINPPLEDSITTRAIDATLTEMQGASGQRTRRDPLTGLDTRGQLLEHISEHIWGEGGTTALGCVGLDHFETVTGSSGYTAGDYLLKTVAKRLAGTVSGARCVAFLGGSRFGFVAPTPNSGEAIALADAVRSDLARPPFQWNGRSLPVSASLGLTLVSQSNIDPEFLLAAADTACTAAQRAGGDRIILFHDANQAIAEQRKAIDDWICAEEVVRSKRIRLRAQPIVATDSIPPEAHHHEVLLSVYGEKGDALPLMDFIHAAEAFNRMTEVDTLVIETALSWVHDNPAAAMRLGGIAINLSGQSLQDEGLVERIGDRLHQLAIEPSFVGFEVTETTAIANYEKAIAIIVGIQALGCRFALDDFGTGMSSYGYLKSLPADFIKIDGAFVRDMLSNPADEAIVKSINEVAHFMGKKTIAEFVCSPEIRERLQALGVDYVQGFAVAKPFFLDEINARC